MIRIGAHQSIAGGYHSALKSIYSIGGNCLQIFSSSPRGWNFKNNNINDKDLFQKQKLELDINPVYFHASYLINLADTGRIGRLSIQSLIKELIIASEYGIKGSIIHVGSFKNEFQPDSLSYKNLVTAVKTILKQTPQNTLFIIENAGNNKVGKKLDEIAAIIQQVNDNRVRVCLDTCHLFSAGYDLSTPEKLDQFLEIFDSLIGFDRLELFHLNDSRDQYNSGRDRHENIGQGTIPIEEFKLIINHHKLNKVPYIIETPGFDGKGPDKKNLDILKKLLKH